MWGTRNKINIVYYDGPVLEPCICACAYLKQGVHLITSLIFIYLYKCCAIKVNAVSTVDGYIMSAVRTVSSVIGI